VCDPIRRGLLVALTLLLTAVPVAAAAPATPAPVVAADSSLAAMLRLLPAFPLATAELDYADYARQRHAFGLDERPQTDAETQLQSAVLSELVTPFDADLSAPGWKEGLGFDRWDIDQMLEFRDEDTSITILRGRFDEAALRRAWDRAGYQPQQEAGLTFYALGEDWDIDFDDPVSMLHFGSFSYFLLLDSDTIVGSATRASTDELIRVRAGQIPTMADEVGIAPLLSAVPPDLVTAILHDGSWLRFPADAAVIANNPNIAAGTREAVATRIANDQIEATRMPPILTVLAGFTAGGPTGFGAVATPIPVAADAPIAHDVAVATMGSTEAAGTAASVAADRLEKEAPRSSDFARRPYVDLFPTRTVQVVPGQPVVLVDLVPAPDVPASAVCTLIGGQDLTFLLWLP